MMTNRKKQSGAFRFNAFVTAVLLALSCERNTSLFVSAIPSSSAAEAYHVETFTPSDLQRTNRLHDFIRILSTTGLLAIVPEENGMNHEEFSDDSSSLQSLCNCEYMRREEHKNDHLVNNIAETILDDGMTKRFTIATATVGLENPLSLPSEEDIEKFCGVSERNEMDAVRDKVAHATRSFISAFDRLLSLWDDKSEGQHQKPLLVDSHGGSYRSIQSIVESSNNLEHFHVYSKSSTVESDGLDLSTLDLHTDAGLFLAFVPGYDCKTSSNSSNNSSFYVKDEHGVLRPVVFPTGSVAIMIGAGAEKWLETSFPIKATRHSVKMHSGQIRAWYGMMNLVPDNAVIQSYPVVRTFSDMKTSMILSSSSPFQEHSVMKNQHESDAVLGCGHYYDEEIEEEFIHQNSLSTSSPTFNRRRVQHMDPSSCDNVTNFFCWMTCVDIPDLEDAQTKLYEQGESLYCLDEAILDAGNVEKAISTCDEGRYMSSKCVGSWQPTVSGLPASPLVIEKPPQSSVRGSEKAESKNELDYCYGGISMFMDGFRWTTDECVIYLFPELILDTASKFNWACIGTVFLCFLLEYIVFLRKRMLTLKQLPPGLQGSCISALSYGTQLCLGYLIMLLVMTYSGPIFLSILIGLMGGHLLFNANDPLVQHCGCASRKPKNEDNDDNQKKEDSLYCCESNTTAKTTSGEAIYDTDDSSSKCYGAIEATKLHSKEKESSEEEITLGLTPCCAH